VAAKLLAPSQLHKEFKEGIASCRPANTVTWKQLRTSESEECYPRAHASIDTVLSTVPCSNVRPQGKRLLLSPIFQGRLWRGDGSGAGSRGGASSSALWWRFWHGMYIVLWITGRPGMGKIVITIKLRDIIKEELDVDSSDFGLPIHPP
jgi:hypothetical protein